MRLLMHNVYFLVDACGDICYVGRSINPMGRWRSHERKYPEEELQLLIGGAFDVLEEAQAEELHPSLVMV